MLAVPRARGARGAQPALWARRAAAVLPGAAEAGGGIALLSSELLVHHLLHRTLFFSCAELVDSPAKAEFQVLTRLPVPKTIQLVGDTAAPHAALWGCPVKPPREAGRHQLCSRDARPLRWRLQSPAPWPGRCSQGPLLPVAKRSAGTALRGHRSHGGA